MASGHFSKVGEKLTARTGILELMDDLGRAMTVEPDMLMLGGGNPAHVPEIQAVWRKRMADLMADGAAFDRMLANYDPPQGNPRFVKAVAELMRDEFGWPVTEKNVAVTNGTQSTFFFLFTALAGTRAGGKRKKILMPMSPEYIGYADQGLEEDVFVSCRPTISWPRGENQRVFKYGIDFAAVEKTLAGGDIAAMAVSRPCNPTGNVVTDDELKHLCELAEKHGVYVIVDGAYGVPFPGIVFAEEKPRWSRRAIHTFSLSKLGLPGVRTGIMIGPTELVDAVSAMTAIVGLANGNLGQQLALPMIESREILQVGPKILRPFYEQRSVAAQAAVREFFDGAGIDWAMHANEGAFFLWVWLRGLKVPTWELYQRLKKRKVLVVPGEFFFFGLHEAWGHRHECLRISFAQPPEVVREGLKRISEEITESPRP